MPLLPRNRTKSVPGSSQFYGIINKVKVPIQRARSTIKTKRPGLIVPK